MTDLAVLVPSRGRPQNIERLAGACARTCRANTLLVFGFDSDDPVLEESIAAVPRPGGRYSVEPRMGLTAWTNILARKHMDAPYLASIGDDMVPITDGWDEQLITVIEHKFDSIGYAYPDDRRRNDIPEAVVVSTAIVRALGSMIPVRPDGGPVVEHWFCDCIWRDIGMGAGCMAYVPGVVVEHRHPNVTGQPADQTYTDAARTYDADLVAYQRWRLRQMRRDIDTVRACSRSRD